MRRLFFALPLATLLAATGTASADYFRVQIRVEPKFPDMAPGGTGFGMQGGPGGAPGGIQGGAGGMLGAPGGMIGGPGRPGGGGAPGGMLGAPGGGGFGMVGGGFGMGGGGVVPGGGGMRGGFGMVGGGGNRGGFGMPGGGNRGGFGMQGGPVQPGGGGLLGGPGGPGSPGGNPPPEPDNKFPPSLFVYIEVKGVHWGGDHAYLTHKWGKKGLMIGMKEAITFEHVPGKPFTKEFDERYKKDLKEGKGKLSGERLYIHADFALRHHLSKEFHMVMGELAKLDANDPANKEYLAVVKNYQRVLSELKKAPAADDPTNKSIADEAVADAMKPHVSDGGHYVLYTKLPKSSDIAIKHKLALLEDTLANFYYWFALQKNTEQPPLPRTRLMVVLTDRETFQNEQARWGMPPPVADGFTPRRDNVLFMSAQRQDSDYTKLDGTLRPFLEALNASLLKANVPTDGLLSGKVWDDKAAVSRAGTQPIGTAETLLIVRKALEEEAERATITYEGTRQLLIGAGLFPRHVNVPEWVLSGLSSYFETPVQSVYGGVGLPSWSHLVSFKFLQKEKGSKLNTTPPIDVLYNVITDRYFDAARKASDDAAEHNDDKSAEHAKEAWELARCTAWSLVYHLASNGRVNELLDYGRELEQLPRDLPLSEQVLQACAARALKISEPQNANKIDLNGRGRNLASGWFKQMESLTLDLPSEEQVYLGIRKLQSAQQGKQNVAGPPGGPNGPGPGGFNGPGTVPPPGGFNGPGVPPPGGFKGPGGR